MQHGARQQSILQHDLAPLSSRVLPQATSSQSRLENNTALFSAPQARPTSASNVMLECVDRATVCKIFRDATDFIMPCRWLGKRIMRYSHIICKLDQEKERDGKGEGSLMGILKCGVPPLLPSILAACAPSAELSLDVQSSQGKPPAATHYKRTPLQCITLGAF